MDQQVLQERRVRLAWRDQLVRAVTWDHQVHVACRDQSVLLGFLALTACPERREVLAQQVLPVRKGHVATQVTLEKQVWQERRVLPARVTAAVQAVNLEPPVALVNRVRRDH